MNIIFNMEPIEYIKSALRTEPEKYDFLKTNDVSPRIEHGVMGLVSEAGELMQAVKHGKIYGKPIDKVNIIEEMGDVMWYMAILADELGVSFEEIWEKNISKLEKRYPEKFNKKDAIERDLRGERAVLEEEKMV